MEILPCGQAKMAMLWICSWIPSNASFMVIQLSLLSMTVPRKSATAVIKGLNTLRPAKG